MGNGVNIRDLNGLEASISQFPLVGFTVLWRLAGIRVSHSDLEQALRATGFEKYLPDPPTPRVALRRALAEWIRAKQKTARTLQLQLGDEEIEAIQSLRVEVLSIVAIGFDQPLRPFPHNAIQEMKAHAIDADPRKFVGPLQRQFPGRQIV